MRQGDKVRMLRGVEEGHVVRLINDKLVEIETSDGFTMPALITDLVVISNEENKYFERPQKDIETVEKPKASQPGVFLVFEQEEGKKVAEVLFINNTEDAYLVVASEVNQQGYYTTKINSSCAKHTSIKLSNYHLGEFDSWPSIAFHLTQLDTKNGGEPVFIKKLFTAKAKNFFNKKISSPLRNNPAFVFNLLENSTKVDAEKLTDQLNEGKGLVTPSKKPYSPIIEVDLHIQTLREDFDFLKPEEILPFQLQAFEKALDDAIANNCDEITFIHGVGAGKLKYEISKILSKHPNVKFYQDADKQKFGYGATKATLK